jgi:hypothetical protein
VIQLVGHISGERRHAHTYSFEIRRATRSAELCSKFVPLATGNQAVNFFFALTTRRAPRQLTALGAREQSTGAEAL